MERSLFSLLVFLAGFFSLFLMIYNLRQQQYRLNKIFSFFTSAAAVYAFGYGFELSSHTLENILFWSKIQYIGISPFPGLMLFFALCYTGREDLFNRIGMSIIFLIPAATLLMRFTNPHHLLFYASTAVEYTKLGPLLKIDPGPFYYIHVLYMNFVWLISTVLLIRFYFRAASTYQKQTLIMLTASSIQWCGLVIYLFGIGPKNLDINPILISLSAVLYAFGIFKFSLLDLKPTARNTVFEKMRDAVMVMDIHLRLVDFNERCFSLFPEISKKSIGKNIKEILSNYPELLDMITNHRNNIEMSFTENEKRTYVQLSIDPLYNEKKIKIGAILTFTDISRLKKLIDELAEMATVDELTGIFNRRHLIHSCEMEVKRTLREKAFFSLMILDLDRFKSINDIWGHNCGDLVLKTFSALIKENIREIDVFGRYGGEEFVIALPKTDKQTAVKIGERLCRIISEALVMFNEQKIRFTVSIGVTGIWEQGGISTLDLLIQNADLALYDAKRNGRNRVAVYETALRSHT